MTTTGATTGEATFQATVPEMDCASCAQAVEQRLQKLEGITEIDLQPVSGTVHVQYDPDVTTTDAITAAIQDAGYRIETTTDAESPGVSSPRTVWRSRRAILTWIAAGLLVPGLLLEVVVPGNNVPILTTGGLTVTVADGLLLGAVGIAGYPVVRDGIGSLRGRSLDIDLLMSIAILAAVGIGYYVEAATLAVLYSIAELLEDYAMDRARDSLRELVELAPQEATVRREGTERTVPVAEIDPGETVIVRPGGKIPMDGEVTTGTSAVDESPVTGESVPVDKAPGDEVYAGSINTGGYLEIEVTASAGDSTLSRVIELVQNAQRNRTDIEQFVDRFAGYYTPVIVVFAVLVAAVPPVVFGGAWRTWIIRGLTLLVIACPCAFVISTPVSVVSGITSAAKNGVLVKGGEHLETMGAVDTVVFDKTGTLTTGELRVTDVVPVGDRTSADILRRAASIEQHSEHPIGSAIREYAAEQGQEPTTDATAFENLPGKGVKAEFDGTTYYVGTPALFEARDIDLGPIRERTDGGTVTAAEDSQPTYQELSEAGKTVVVVGSTSGVHGMIAVADTIRPGAAQAVNRLKEQGVEQLVMLTGDTTATATAIAEHVGIETVHAELLPEEKVTAVEDLQAAGATVAMVGDGINDAPALATADVGIAMGAAGTDTAIETADIALLGDDITKVPYLYRLARTANTVIRQNIWSSLGVKALLAIGVPFGYVTVAIAVLVGDMGMSLGVTGNAMRLSRIRPEDDSTPTAGKSVQ